MDLSSGLEELKNRLELLLGEKPPAPIDESLQGEVERQAKALQSRERMAVAGGQLLTAAFTFLGEMFPESAPPEGDRMTELFRKQLAQCMEKNSDGSLRMTISLPDESILDKLAASLARIARAA